MVTINELIERGVASAGVLCPTCSSLFSVRFCDMFLDGKTEYGEISVHREFRCPTCSSQTKQVIPFTVDTVPPLPAHQK